MNETNLSELARQGEPKAIAVLMNRSLQPKGITAKVTSKAGCLQVLLEAEQLPEQKVWVAFVRSGLTSLDAKSIEKVKVYGRQLGEDIPAWSAEFELVAKDNPFANPKQVQTKQLDSRVQVLQIKSLHPVQSFTAIFMLTLLASIFAIVLLGLTVSGSYFFSLNSILFFLFLSFAAALGVTVLDVLQKNIVNARSKQNLKKNK